MHRTLLFFVFLLLVLAPVSSGAAGGLVISQIYAGGGNSGAAYANDFVELLNRSSSTVDLSGWTVQYASASSTSWQATTLSGSLAPGRYYLVALGSSGSAGAALPAFDAMDTTNMAVSGGKVTLVHDTNVLTCGASAGSCSAVSTVVDLVGYGSATDYESAAAPALSATLSAMRTGNGCTDTNANDADFDAVAPAPRNTVSTTASCSGGGGGGGSSVTQSAAVDVDVSSALSLTLEHASLSFGTASAGQTPASLGDKLTVVSNSATGYAVSVHRSVFTPADLPFAVSVSGGALTRIPVAPAADLVLATTSAPSGASGDVWPASFGFATALPVVPPGHYTSTITFTVIGR
jgi:predicted extracellular nuclease